MAASSLNEPVTESIPVAPAEGQEKMGYLARFATWERALIALVVGVIAFGGATGNIWVAFPACVVMVATIFGLAATPRRKHSMHRVDKRAGVILGVAWAAVVIVIALVLFFVPASLALTGGVAAALLAAAVVWGAIAYADRPAHN